MTDQAQAPFEGHRQRLKTRFAKTGLVGFTPREALELLLTYAIPRRDTRPIAMALLSHFGGLPQVMMASMEELCQVPGIGEHTAGLIALITPMMQLFHQTLSDKGDTGPQALRARCLALLMGERFEKFYVLALDDKGRIINESLIARGDEGAATVSPRLVAGALLRVSARGCVLVHNHPSGIPTPSAEDLALTRAIKKLCTMLQITLVDHIIVAGQTTLSLAEQGLLPL